MDHGSRRVGEVMQTKVASLAPDDRLDLADDLMRFGHVRHMPVVEGGRLVGILSTRDVLAASLTKALEFEATQRRSFLRSVVVREVMSDDVATVQPDTLLRDAAQILLARKIGCLPVVDEERTLVGLLTETDLLRAAYA